METREKSDQYIDEICSSTWKEVYRFIYYKVQNREEAEDITQETYEKALPYLQSDQVSESSCTGFLKTIAFNIIRDNWRKQKRRGTEIHLDDTVSDLLGTDDFADGMVDREWIMDAMNSLNAEWRRVVELRVIKGYSVAETAKIMDKSEGNIRVMQYRALQSIASLLYGNSYKR
jgi:RNA polymerase sigma-70 factor (ECF subfamily)